MPSAPRRPIPSVPSGPRERGVVSWFNDARGFGFLNPENGGPDVFVHYSGLRADSPHKRRTVFPGDEVTFTRGTGPDGRPLAVDVEVVAPANPDA